MKRRLIAFLLVLALAVSVLPMASAAEYEGLHMDRILPALHDLMMQIEGTYTSVTRNDNGALSIGFIQWHGGQALNLLKAIAERNPEDTKAILGETLYASVKNDSYKDWYARTLSADEGKRIGELLGTDDGIAVQDEFAAEYFADFVAASWKAGMRTDATVVYYSTMYNQFGSGGVKTYMRNIRATMGVDESATFYDLNVLHKAVDNTTYGHAYFRARTKTYNFIRDRGWSLTGLDVPGCPNCPGEAFYDMPSKSNWAHAGIEFVIEQGLFRGESEHRFNPGSSMTRAMLVTVLHRLDGSPKTETVSAFEDVGRDHYYTPAVDWAVSAELVNGVREGVFAPDKTLTREQFAAILYRYSNYKQNLTAPTADLLESFADREEVSDYAVEPMLWATACGIINGDLRDGQPLLCPKDPVTRAQVATMLLRYCSAQNK